MKTEASAKSELNLESTKRMPRFTDRMATFASTGIACPLAWGFLMNAFGGVSPSAQLPWTLSYLLLAVAVLIFAAVSRKAPAFSAPASPQPLPGRSARLDRCCWRSR